MLLASHKSYTYYEVIDLLDSHKTYGFDSMGEAVRWLKELIEDFDADAKNLSMYARDYDEFGNLVSQTKLY